MKRYGIRAEIIVFEMESKSTVYVEDVDAIIIEVDNMAALKTLVERIRKQVESVFSIISWTFVAIFK